MEYRLTSTMGIGQANKLIPEIMKVCSDKNLTTWVRSMTRINWLTCKFEIVLYGDETNLNYVSGWISGYIKSCELNKPKVKNNLPPLVKK